MHSKDILKQSFQNVFRKKKKTILTTILFSILFVIIFLCLVFQNTITQFVDDFYYKSYAGKEYLLNVKYSELDIIKLHNHLKEIKGITKIVEEKARLTNFIGIEEHSFGLNGMMLLGGDNDMLPEVIGNKFQDDNKKIQLICPKYMIASGYDQFDSTNYIDMTNQLNKNITLLIDEYEYSNAKPNIIKTHQLEAEVVGLYEAQINNYPSDYCLTTFESVKAINKINSINNYVSFIIVIDDYRNYEDIHNQVTAMIKNEFNLESSLSPLTELANEDIQLLQSIITLVLSITTVICLFSLIIIIVKNIKKNEIGTYKAIGYDDKTISRLYNLENMITIILSAIIGFIITFGIVSIIRGLSSSKYYSLLAFSFEIPYFKIILTGAIITIITILISILCFNKIQSKTITNLLKN